MQEQEQLQATLRQDDGVYAKKLDGLIQQAEDLQSLVENLEQQRTKQDANFANIQPVSKPNIPNAQPPMVQATPLKPTSPRAANFAANKGRLPLPVTGAVVGKFGERRGANDRLKGLEIKPNNAAIVISPFEGEVLFTGPFLEYGNMVIIRHSKQYHTLIAGLSQINVRRGEFLLEGATIGAMGNSNQQNLYLELRKHSQAIDPAPWYDLNNNYAKR